MMFFLSILYMEIMGLALVRIFCRVTRYRARPVEILSLSFFVGTLAVALLLFFYDRMGIAFKLRSVLPPVAICAAVVTADVLALFFWGNWDKELPTAFRPWTLTEKLLVAGIVVQLLWIIFATLPMPVNSHDALANYALKAKMFWLDRGIPEGYFGWQEATVAHPDYPLLLPLVMTWVYLFTGFNDLIVTLVMPVFYAAAIGLIFSQLAKLFSRKYALLMAFIFATIPQFVDYATVVHTDMILGGLVGGAAGYLVLYMRYDERRYILLSSVLLGIAFWVKNEAVVFAFVLALVVSAFVSRKVTSRRPAALADLLIAFAVMAVIAWPWMALRSAEGLVNCDLDPSKLTLNRLLENMKQIPLVLDAFQQQIFGPKKWNIFWMALLAAMVWKRKKLTEGVVGYLLLFLGVSLLCYFAAYMMINGPDNLYFYAKTTMSRFMIHFTGIALFIIAFLVKDDMEEALSTRNQ